MEKKSPRMSGVRKRRERKLEDARNNDRAVAVTAAEFGSLPCHEQIGGQGGYTRIEYVMGQAAVCEHSAGDKEVDVVHVSETCVRSGREALDGRKSRRFTNAKN